MGRRRRRGSNSLVPRITLAWSLLTSLGPSAARADEATGVLRVRSTPHFTAIRVSPEGDGQRIEGLLHDERNAPVAGVGVELSKGQRFRACESGSAVTNEHGHFCLWTSTGADTTSLAFRGDSHFDPTTLALSLHDAAPPPSLSVDTAREWIVGRQDNSVRVLVDNTPADSDSQLRLRVLDDRGVEHMVLQDPVEGRTTLFRVAPERLPPAGPLRLEVTLISGTSSELAKTNTTIDAVALVEVTVERLPEKVRSGEEIAVTAVVSGDAQPLNSGWVEVRGNNQPLAIEAVNDGRASLRFELSGSREYSTELSFQYVSEKPWYRPSGTAQRPITVLGPLPWVHLPWAVLALGAGLWVMRTWRRPLRAVLQSLANNPTLFVQGRLEATSGPASEWSGVVRDAHTKQALAGVNVVLYAPSLHAARVLRESVTDSTGRFVLDRVEPLPEGACLMFTFETHSTLNQLAPGPCTMAVDLVDRRRTVLSAFHEWATRTSLTRVLEPTPGDVIATARRVSDTEAAAWAVRVDEAVFGPAALDASTEEQLLRERPAPAQTGAKAR